MGLHRTCLLRRLIGFRDNSSALAKKDFPGRGGAGGPRPTLGPMTDITLISFGYLHSAPPRADRVEDLRARYRDPAAAAGASSTSTAGTLASKRSCW